MCPQNVPVSQKSRVLAKLLKLAKAHPHPTHIEKFRRGPNQFLKIYALCTPERYDFMHCDLQANPPLAYHCFDLYSAGSSTVEAGKWVGQAVEEGVNYTRFLRNQYRRGGMNPNYQPL